KRLQRARERVGEFMERRCGLVRSANPCRCEKMIGISVGQGLLDPEQLIHRAKEQRLLRQDPKIEALLEELHDLDEKVRAILKSHPTPTLSAAAASRVQALLTSGNYEM